MTNGNPYYSFYHFLCDRGELTYEQKNCFRHANDLIFKDLIIQINVMSKVHANHLWRIYQLSKKEKK